MAGRIQGTVTALAVALLSPKEVVEQVAVPIAQNNDQANYSYGEGESLIILASLRWFQQSPDR